MWRWWTGPVALCLAETLCIVCSSPPKMPKRWVEQRGVGPFSRGHWHIFPPRGETRVEKLNASSNSIHFLKKFCILHVCCLWSLFFWRYQCFTIWTVYNNAISIWLLFFYFRYWSFPFFFPISFFRIVGYDGVQQTFKDYFKFKEDKIFIFKWSYVRTKKWFGKIKKMQNTLIYILHSTDHLSLFERANDQKLCLVKQTGLLYKVNS